MSLCPACSETGYPFVGRKESKYLLVFSKPYVAPAVRSYKDKVTGIDVLRKEFARVGLDLTDFRQSWLWLHEPTKEENCYTVARDMVLDNAKGKAAVILVGAEPVEEFSEYSADTVYGLQIDSMSLSAPLVFVLPKPEGVFVKGAGIGELRLSIEKLGRLLG